MTVPVTRSTALVAAALDRNRYLFLQNPFYEVPNSSPKQVLDRVESLIVVELSIGVLLPQTLQGPLFFPTGSIRL